MENNELTEEMLEHMPKEVLIQMALMLQGNINQLNRNVELLTEQLEILIKKSEQKKKMRWVENLLIFFVVTGLFTFL